LLRKKQYAAKSKKGVVGRTGRITPRLPNPSDTVPINK